jgi:hypothetical protein
VHACASLCRELKVAIPVGKDSLSMRTVWRDDEGREKRVSAPTSLVVTAFAPVADVRRALTPQLVADTDTLKSTALRLPTWDRFEPGRVHLQSVPFDTFEAEAPYETREAHAPELFRTFAERAAPLWANWGYEPLLPTVWPRVVRYPDTIGERFALVRRSYERNWGCRNLELPVSRLARTDAFRRFATHILADRERFRAVYNAAVGAYRQAHGIRSDNHPVPDLAPGETPFWGGPDPAGRRTRTVTRVDDQTRPRALTLTLFCRLCLGDFFLHGIGGGKYDEVTDAIIRGYFGVEPPRYGVLSATLHLPLPTFPATADTVRQLHHRERDLRWNPQRHGAGGPAGDRKAALIRNEPAGRAERREWFRQLRDATERLQPFYATLENLLWPDLFVVGGGISRKADRFLPLLRLRTPIVPAALENTAGIVGAAALSAD